MIPPIIRAVRDERGVIVNWLVKLILGVVIGGVILYDAGSIAVNFFGLDSAADEVANVVSTEMAAANPTPADLQALQFCKKRPSANRYCQLLQQEVKKHDAKLMKAHVDEKGVLKVRLRRTTSTLVVGRIGFIEDWATSTSEGKASTSTQ